MSPSPAPAALAPDLPDTQIDIGLSAAQKTLRGLSRFAHTLAERMLISPSVNAPKLWEQAQGDPRRFAARVKFSGSHALEARWSAAVMAARAGRLEPVVEALRSNALFCPPNDNHHFVDEQRHMATPRADLAALAARPGASLALLEALANANIPTHIANGVIGMAFDAILRLPNPLQAMERPNVKVNFARGLRLLSRHCFEDSMIAIAQAPNLPDLARCGLLAHEVWRERSPFAFHERQSPDRQAEGAVRFVYAIFGAEAAAGFDAQAELNTAMMLRAFLSRSHLSGEWLADAFHDYARRCPRNQAFLARVAALTFDSPKGALKRDPAFIQAFERKAFDADLPSGSPARPSLSRAL